MSSLAAKLNTEGWSESHGDFRRLVCGYPNIAGFQSEKTVVNIHAREDEKALEKAAHGRVPRKSQHVLSCALSGERKAHSPSRVALCYRLCSKPVSLPAAPKLKSKALV